MFILFYKKKKKKCTMYFCVNTEKSLVISEKLAPVFYRAVVSGNGQLHDFVFVSFAVFPPLSLSLPCPPIGNSRPPLSGLIPVAVKPQAPQTLHADSSDPVCCVCLCFSSLILLNSCLTTVGENNCKQL